jgi:pyrimidine deaminase RibD-like protein
MSPHSPEFDRSILEVALRLSRLAPPSRTAFSVGCAIVDAAGEFVATGFSRELGAHWHAEAVAIEKARRADVDLSSCSLYSSLEPCSVRRSGRESCCDLIGRSGLRRVVFGMREPPIFVNGRRAEMLRASGIEVIEVEGLEAEVRAVNAHLLDPASALAPAHDDQVD